MIDRCSSTPSRRRWATGVALLLALGACGPARDSDEARWVSLIQLIADPEAYDGQRVTVVGVLRLDFEGTALYLGEADAAYGLPTNAVWLSLDGQQIDAYQELGGHYVMLEGRFSAKHHGHFGLYRGSIGEVRGISRLPTVKEHRQRQMPDEGAEEPETREGGG